MTRKVQKSSHKRKYIVDFLKMCPKQPLESFLADRVVLPEEYRLLAIRRFVYNRTPKQLALEFCVSVWWIGEKLRKIEETLIPQLESFFLECINIFNRKKEVS